MSVVTVGTIADEARVFATEYHADDLNKHDGERYIYHVQRVAEHLRRAGADDVIIAIAWLHDVVEDTSATLEEIRERFGDRIGDAVDAITHRPHEPRTDYYERVGANRDALIVKMSDGRDNQDPARKANLSPDVRERLDLKYRLQNWALAPWIIHHLRSN